MVGARGKAEGLRMPGRLRGSGLDGRIGSGRPQAKCLPPTVGLPNEGPGPSPGLRPVHLHNSWHLAPLIITVPILQRRRGRDKRINHKDVKLQHKDLSPKPGSPGQALNPSCSTSYVHSTREGQGSLLSHEGPRLRAFRVAQGCLCAGGA